MRKRRITSSLSGKDFKRKAPNNDKFFDSLFENQDVNSQSIDYGKRNESSAKEKYLEVYPGRHLHECGLVINNDFAFLGASPDA